nr:hypothetical protein FAC10E3_54 [Penicillium camemberti]
MPASGNENDLNMPSGTIEIFVRCYVEVERIITMMWSVLLQPVVLAAVERQGEALGWLPSPLGWRPSMALQTRQKRRRSRVRDTAAGRRRCGYLAENLALTDR